MLRRRPRRRSAPAVATLAALLVAALPGASGAAAATAAPPASRAAGSAAAPVRSTVLTIRTPAAPDTPRRYDRVRVRRYGPASARAVLVLVPGTFGGAGDFHLLGPALVRRIPGLQVWAQMRREGALHDTAMLERARAGRATVRAAFDYYLGWLANAAVRDHYQPLDASRYGFVKQWGLKVALDDLHAVVRQARAGGRRTVVLGGHSLGASVAGIYPAWDFGGRPGVRDLAGVVEIDGGAGGEREGAATTAAQARELLARLDRSGPFADLLGLGLPWIAGAFGELSALAASKEPTAPSVAATFPLLPPAFRTPFPATNRGQLGYAFDASTSPPGLALIQVRSGHLGDSGEVRDWVDDGPTPIANLANAFSLEPLGAIEWYYPARLSLDVGVASSLNATAAARTLGLRIRHVRKVDIPLYAFAAALAGRDGALATGTARYKRLSKIPRVTLVDHSDSYSHLDPLLADPQRSALVRTLVPWLRGVLRRPVR
jgi:hypothetical protein